MIVVLEGLGVMVDFIMQTTAGFIISVHACYGPSCEVATLNHISLRRISNLPRLLQ